MQSRHFGVAWTVHQTLPVYIGTMLPRTQQNTAALRSAISLETFALSKILPCRFCRDSYAEFLEQLDFQERIVTARLLTMAEHKRFFYDIHNLVNAKLDKPIQKRIEPGYSDKTASSTREFSLDLLDWLFIVAMNQPAITDRSSLNFLDRIMTQIQLTSNLEIEQVNRLIERGPTDLAKTRAWLIVYIHSILQILSLLSDTTLASLYNLLHNALFTSVNCFKSSDHLFACLYDVYIHFGHTSRARLYAHYDSLKAGRCVGNQCSK